MEAMLAFAAERHIKSVVGIMPFAKVNEAIDMVRKEMLQSESCCRGETGNNAAGPVRRERTWTTLWNCSPSGFERVATSREHYSPRQEFG